MLLKSEILSKIKKIELRSKKLVDDVFSGKYHSVFKGQGLEFSEVREYVPGDDVRRISWNVTARRNKPYIKKYDEEREQTVMFVVDLSASGPKNRRLYQQQFPYLHFPLLKTETGPGFLLLLMLLNSI